ncbi:MAG: SLC13/DASS family transporter [Polyangiaceae bacterium]|nr:SLC13/DASS family transporter [Polyangiaceae bacterium]
MAGDTTETKGAPQDDDVLPPPLPSTPPPAANDSASNPIVRGVGIALAIAVFLFLTLYPTELQTLSGFGKRPAYAAAVAALMAVLWLFEAIPIAMTACLPIALYPVLGVFGDGLTLNAGKALSPFTDAYIFLFFGGMMIGGAMEEQGLHRRVALHILRAIGTRPRRLLFGMLAATALVSLWISNTATAVMMVPIAVALLHELEAGEKRKLPGFGASLLLAVAYASNVGGIGTKIGTATNSIFLGFVTDKMKTDIGFVRYLAFGLPFVVLFLPIVWAVLWLHARRDHIKSDRGREVIEHELNAMGTLRGPERRVAFVFCLAAFLWIFGDLLRPFVSPWLSMLIRAPASGKHYEAFVSLLAGGLLVLTKSIRWSTFRKIPWSTLLLLGGSFAMAAGIEGSGLGQWMAQRFTAVAQMPFVAQVGLTALGTVLLSAVASNTATMNIALNVLPRSLPVLGASAIAASCDFMLPAGTPPNAIVFGSGAIRLPVMMRVGFALDLLAVIAITAYVMIYGQYIL